MKKISKLERCAFCNCILHRSGIYARPTIEGRSHATKHHLVAERFFGRSTNRKGTKTNGIFDVCPWGQESITEIFCYECHEELLHNPVFLVEDVRRFAEIVKAHGFSENEKTNDRSKLAGRVRLFHDALAIGLKVLHEQASQPLSTQ